MKAKLVLSLLAAVGLTAVITYLWVSNHYLREQAARWQAELARAEAERSRLEYELTLAQEQARSARTPPPPSSTEGKPATNASRPLPPALPVRSGGDDRLERGPAVVPVDHATDVGALGAAPVVGVVPAVAAPAWARYIASPTGSVCVIVGGAAAGRGEARPWKVEGRIIAGYFEHDARFDFSQPPATMIRLWGSNAAARAEVSIPVRFLKSQVAVGAGEMDRQMQKAMNAQRYPNLEFTLTSLTWDTPTENPERTWPFTCRGRLSLNGVTKDWTWQGIVEPIGSERLQLSAAQRLSMRDFNIIPPVASVAGVTLQTEEAVTVYLSWMLTRENPATAAR